MPRRQQTIEEQQRLASELVSAESEIDAGDLIREEEKSPDQLLDEYLAQEQDEEKACLDENSGPDPIPPEQDKYAKR